MGLGIEGLEPSRFLKSTDFPLTINFIVVGIDISIFILRLDNKKTVITSTFSSFGFDNPVLLKLYYCSIGTLAYIAITVSFKND